MITTFQVELPLASLFGSATIADMAVVITQSRAGQVGREDIERMLAELETLSDEQVDQRLVDGGQRHRE